MLTLISSISMLIILVNLLFLFIFYSCVFSFFISVHGFSFLLFLFSFSHLFSLLSFHHDIQVKESLEETAKEPLDLSWPNLWHKRISYILLAPIIFPLWLTLPDVRRPVSCHVYPIFINNEEEKKGEWKKIVIINTIITRIIFDMKMVKVGNSS